MKRFLVFIASYQEAALIPGLKQQVKDYLGKRMIENDCEDYPALVLNQELNDEDYTQITSLVEKLNSQSVSILVIEAPANLLNKYVVSSLVAKEKVVIHKG